MTDKTTYLSLVKQMAEDGAPIAALALATADARRRQNLKRLAGDIRFAGINELLVRLSGIGKAFSETPELSRITFMVQRAHADFMTALEATLSGYFSVASDAMRDVLEIQYLLMDFAINPDHAEEWLTTDEKGRMKDFSPAAVRRRLQAAGVVNFGDRAVSMDYKGHSMALHVSPVRLLNSADGIVAQHSWLNEAGFWEIFDHGHGLMEGLTLLVDRLVPGSRAADIVGRDLKTFDEARGKAHELMRLWERIPDARAALRAGDRTAAGGTLFVGLTQNGLLDGTLLKREVDEEWGQALEGRLQELMAGDEPIARAAATMLHVILTEDDSEATLRDETESPAQD
ncbi:MULTISPECIES: hypothetical protein [Streptomyces]|uniref:hypothetical protein n=1 Tax=Streptomyces TaxID=1883 RepID=UPI0004BE035B|nr:MULTISPECIES: hypothetical protein [Streptomyces]